MLDLHPWNEYYYERELGMAKQPKGRVVTTKEIPLDQAVCPPYDPKYQGKNAVKEMK